MNAPFNATINVAVSRHILEVLATNSKDATERRMAKLAIKAAEHSSNGIVSLTDLDDELGHTDVRQLDEAWHKMCYRVSNMN